MTQKPKTPCRCPYCSTPLLDNAAECLLCSVEVTYCGTCGRPLPRDASFCPDCGAKRPTLPASYQPTKPKE